MTGRDAFLAFRDAVLDDAALLRRLRTPRAPQDYVDDVVAVGRAAGYVFEGEDVQAAMREGHRVWLMQGVDFEP